MSGDDPLAGRCGTCARFVRVSEIETAAGQVRRAGECLLGVWSPPLFETNTCSQYVRRGTFTPKKAASSARRARGPSRPSTERSPAGRPPISLPEDLLAMDANEFRAVLKSVLQDELGLSDVPLGNRWEGGELVLKPGREGIAEKRIPVEAFFHKVVMVRDKLRVLEQKLNAHPKLSDEEKVQMQQYVTQCYGSLTTFNILFAERDDAFKGQSGKDE